MKNELRWVKSFSNFITALQSLNSSEVVLNRSELSHKDKQNVVDEFIYTHEMACRTLKDYLSMHDITDLRRHEEITMESHKLGIISNRENWVNMIKTRCLTSEIYSPQVVHQVSSVVFDHYIPELNSLSDKLSELKETIAV